MEPDLKKRLIGAVVLVALAVIFLPMLIKGPAPDSGVSDVSMKVPEEPAGQFVEIPLATPGETPAGGAVGMPAAQPVATAPAPQPAAQGALPAATAAGDYAVSFGAYATQADANAVIAALKQAGLPGFSVADTINGQPAWRVRIGPYADRAQAEIVRLEAAKVRSDVKTQVIALDAVAATAAAVAATQPVRSEPLPPAPRPAEPAKPVPAKTEPAKPVAAAPKPEPAKTEPKPAPAPTTPKPAASSTGFAVQMGAFSDVAQATALRDSLRSKGFSAFVEKVNTDGGTLSRVRVGPVATREAAEALRAKLGSGQVRPHP